MPIDVLMPQLSPTMTEGRLARWTKNVGDAVRVGDVMAEVETDKATMEVEAPEDGTIHAIIGQPGADILVGAPIAVLAKKGETVPATYQPVFAAKPAQKDHDVKPADVKVEAAIPHATEASPKLVKEAFVPKDLPKPEPKKTAKPAAKSSDGHVFATPLARRLAEQKGTSLAAYAGSGPRGRVTAEDILRGPSMGGGANTAAITATSNPGRAGDVTEKPAPMRRAIAAALTKSKQTVPHFYLTRSVDMRRLMDARAEWNESLAEQGIKLTVNDFIVKACGLALADHPAANASWNDDGTVTSFGNVDISVAVSIEGGLITPVVKNADAKSLAELSAEVKQLAADARASKLKPEQYTGGSFSISNLGMYGIEEFSAIINAPQAAILAVGATNKDGVMKITLSVDHRVIDGALGAELLASIVAYLEKPATMLA
jgi:pyruvate dehydrogenase E2 component (dihydrolipoamide acetyltransferase)